MSLVEGRDNRTGRHGACAAFHRADNLADAVRQAGDAAGVHFEDAKTLLSTFLRIWSGPRSTKPNSNVAAEIEALTTER